MFLIGSTHKSIGDFPQLAHFVLRLDLSDRNFLEMVVTIYDIITAI